MSIARCPSKADPGREHHVCELLFANEDRMYPGSLRCNSSSSSSNLPAKTFASGTAYTNYLGYYAQSMNNPGQSSEAWELHYDLQREDWNAYGAGSTNTTVPTSMDENGTSPGHLSFSSADYGTLNPAGSGELLWPPVDTADTEQVDPHHQRPSSYEWMRKTAQSTGTGMLERLNTFYKSS